MTYFLTMAELRRDSEVARAYPSLPLRVHLILRNLGAVTIAAARAISDQTLAQAGLHSDEIRTLRSTVPRMP